MKLTPTERHLLMSVLSGSSRLIEVYPLRSPIHAGIEHQSGRYQRCSRLFDKLRKAGMVIPGELTVRYREFQLTDEAKEIIEECAK